MKVLYFFKEIAARKKKKPANRQFFNGVEKPAILSQVRPRGIHVSVAPEARQFFINWVAIWKFVQRNKKRFVGIRKTKEKLLINRFPDFCRNAGIRYTVLISDFLNCQKEKEMLHKLVQLFLFYLGEKKKPYFCIKNIVLSNCL